MTAESPVKFELVDINAILQTLPHRFPMLLIDRVINIRADYSGIGIKNVTFNEPAFQGHFPERPVYPGVMMIEAMAQTAAPRSRGRSISSPSTSASFASRCCRAIRSSITCARSAAARPCGGFTAMQRSTVRSSPKPTSAPC